MGKVSSRLQRQGLAVSLRFETDEGNADQGLEPRVTWLRISAYAMFQHAIHYEVLIKADNLMPVGSITRHLKEKDERGKKRRRKKAHCKTITIERLKPSDNTKKTVKKCQLWNKTKAL